MFSGQLQVFSYCRIAVVFLSCVRGKCFLNFYSRDVFPLQLQPLRTGAGSQRV